MHEGEQTRLGRGVFDSGKLDPEAIAQTAFVAGRFAEKARRMGAVEVKAVATSAAREARNGMDLIEAFREVNVPLTIVRRPRGGIGAARCAESPIFLMGRWRLSTWVAAATELLVADETGLRVQHSFPLGTVRLLEQHRPSDLPTAQERAKVIEALDQFLDDQVTPLLGTVALPNAGGCGGTWFSSRESSRRRMI